METLDIILLVCFVPALVTGIRKGIVEQVVSLVSVFVGVWAAFKFSGPLAVWMSGFLSLEPKITNIIAFTLMVIIAIVLLSLLGRLLTGVLKLASLSWLNRLAGLVFALLKAALIISLIIFIFNPVNAKYMIVKPEVLESSIVYQSLSELSLKVFPYLKSLIANV